MVIRTPVVVGPSGSGMLGSVGVQSLTDFDSTLGVFETGPMLTAELSADSWGLMPIDIVFDQVPVLRFGVRLGGDADSDDASEGGLTFAWCHQSLYDIERSADDEGFYLDSISVGGFTASSHTSTLQESSLVDYIGVSGRTPNWIVLWLGQNMATDEWNGTLQPAYFDRLEQIADLTTNAILQVNPQREVRVAIVVPPQVSGDFPWIRFSLLRDQAEQFASDRGWAVIDMFGIVGNSLAAIDPSFATSGIHPRLGGSEYVADAWYASMTCWRIDMNGDGVLNFFDVADYLSLFQAGAEKADLNGDRLVNFFDIAEFIQGFSLDCD
jgi:hypothetical protein